MASHPPMFEPGMRYMMWQPAGDVTIPGKGTARERFAPDAFNGSIGKEVPLTYEGREIGRGRVIKAEVAEDGSGVSITYEVLERVPGDSKQD